MILSGKINRAFHNFIPSRPSLTIEESGRRKLFEVFILLMSTGLFVFGTYHIKKSFYILGIIDYLLVFVLAVFILLLRYLKNGKPVYRIGTMLLAVTLLYWIKTGAADGYGSIWVMIFPLVSFFLLGKKEGFIWTLICAAAITVFFINPYSYLSDFTYPPQFISRQLFLFLMILLVSYNYESVREKYKSAMDSEQEKLLLEKEKLAKAKDETDKANHLLKAEMKLREQAEIELRIHHNHLEDIVAERTLEIKKNTEELQASEERYRLMADNVNDLIWATDMNLNFTLISPSVYRLYGYTVEEAMALPLDKWNTPESYNRMISTYLKEKQIIETENSNAAKPVILQLDQIKKDGTIFTVELKVSSIRNETGKVIGIVGITRDISDRIAMEQDRDKIKEQLAQSQKMEALGTLVGGLAHDFNNFLSGIIGSFDLISRALKKENLNKRDYIDKYLQLGIESSRRSAGLINQLLILSKKHEIKLSQLDIKNSLNHIYELCRNSFPKTIKLEFHAEDTPLIILGDTVQIEQVLLNLCINASHAMTIMRRKGEKSGGTLSVTAEKVKPDYIINENNPDTAGIVNHWVKIRVSDNGVGIDSETRQRIFEPFFSTKNESTGLGLAISYNIIKKHGGIVNVYSEEGSGSCFSVYFPFYNESGKVSRETSDNEIVSGTGTVLIIDDEPVILKIAQGFLEQCGYDVLAAEGAGKGIEIYSKEHSRISAVLIDLSMPWKSGLEVFQELQKIRGDVKAVLSSGMLERESKDIAVKMGIKETVNKPYTASELSMKIKSVIG